jgi:hypothetical protein
MGRILVTNTGDSDVTVTIESGQGSRYMAEARILSSGQSTEAVIGGIKRVVVNGKNLEPVTEPEPEVASEVAIAPSLPKRRRAKATKAS